MKILTRDDTEHDVEYVTLAEANREIEAWADRAKAAEKRLAPGLCAFSGNDMGTWESGCGHVFDLTEDGPEKNGFRFCPYCGGLLQETRFVDADG